MKKHLVRFTILAVFSMNNAMEYRYQNSDITGQQQLDVQTGLTHYTLDDLRQNRAMPRNIQEQTSTNNDNSAAQLAFFGLSHDCTADELIDRQRVFEHFIPQQAYQRYRAFSALYLQRVNAQREIQQPETTFFNPNRYNHENYYLPETTNAIDLDAPDNGRNNFFEDIESNHFQDATGFNNDELILQLHHDDIERAVNYEIDLRLADRIAAILGHDVSISSISRTKLQTDRIVQSDSNQPAYESIETLFEYRVGYVRNYRWTIEGLRIQRGYWKGRARVTTRINRPLMSNNNDGSEPLGL